MVIADTNIFISLFRGNEMANTLICRYHTQLAVSVITELELKVGATNAAKRTIMDALLRPYDIIPLHKSVGIIALNIVSTYTTPNRTVSLGDALIAATCINEGAGLLTFNTDDFNS